METSRKTTKIIDYVKGDYKDYHLIEGTPSPDMIATIGTRYLADTLKMVKVAHVESPSIIPVVRITKGVAEHPIRIYASHEHKLLVLVADQVIDSGQVYDFAKEVLDWSKSKKIKGVISLVGVMPNNSPQNIFGATNTKQGTELLLKHKIPILDNGLISGIGAELLILAEKIECSLLVANPGQNTNFESAAKLLELLGEMFNFKIDTKPLEAESKKIVQAIKERYEKVNAQQKEENEKGQMTFV